MSAEQAQAQRPDPDPSSSGMFTGQSAAGAPNEGPPVPPPNGNGSPTTDEVPPTPEGVVKFLTALFDRDPYKEFITLRPTETWTENGRKASRVIYAEAKNLEWLTSLITRSRWAIVVESAAAERANLYFGVCPRPRKGCERAWHIRTIRALWADIDHCTPDEALQRCEKAGLPRPSIVVNSGHGVHLYWLLVEPFLKKKPKSLDRIETKQGILACARKYAERHSLPLPPPRQSRE